MERIIEKYKPILLNAFNKFHSNKKIFWPITISFGLVFFVIILGLIFGKHTSTQYYAIKIPSPSPYVQSTPEATSSGNILIDSQNKLNDLQNQINNLDVRQSRLQPPSVDFNIQFLEYPTKLDFRGFTG